MRAESGDLILDPDKLNLVGLRGALAGTTIDADRDREDVDTGHRCDQRGVFSHVAGENPLARITLGAVEGKPGLGRIGHQRTHTADAAVTLERGVDQSARSSGRAGDQDGRPRRGHRRGAQAKGPHLSNPTHSPQPNVVEPRRSWCYHMVEYARAAPPTHVCHPAMYRGTSNDRETTRNNREST